MIRVLVCGGRKYGRIPFQTAAHLLPVERERARQEQALLRERLDRLHAEREIGLLIHGAAPGADYLAEEWAKERLIETLAFPAQWSKLGNAAGPIRNREMMLKGKPDVIVAFPGASGTADMVKIGIMARVELIEVKRQ